MGALTMPQLSAVCKGIEDNAHIRMLDLDGNMIAMGVGEDQVIDRPTRGKMPRFLSPHAAGPTDWAAGTGLAGTGLRARPRTPRKVRAGQIVAHTLRALARAAPIPHGTRTTD